MEVIPVLDVLGGVAVHARGGDRRAYRPVESVLVDGSDPVALARAYRDRLRLRSCYVADLDAIAGTPPNLDLIRAIAAEGLRLWVDAGVRDAATARAVLDASATCVVVALETLPSWEALGAIAAGIDPPLRAFGLDLRDGRPLGPNAGPSRPDEIVSAAYAQDYHRVIVLDLARIGTGHGASCELLPLLRERSPHAELYVGGGVRDLSELRRLAENGWTGALVATALHRGRITLHDLEQIAAVL